MPAAEDADGGVLRVGTVPYLVGRPLNLGLEEEPRIEVTADVPARLVEGLRAGDLDVALVSSIELFRRPGYRWIPGLCVAGDGFVGSVQLFLARPLAEVRRVALDPASRTARALLQVLAGLDPELPAGLEFVEVPAGEDPRALVTAGGAEAWLRIGDPALLEHLEERLPHYNPSARWAELTGLPFVFAAWIAREGVDLGPHLAAFEAAAARGAEAAEGLARGAADGWALDPELVVDYLVRECRYRLDPERQERALLAFGERARAAGLVPAEGVPTPRSAGTS